MVITKKTRKTIVFGQGDLCISHVVKGGIGAIGIRQLNRRDKAGVSLNISEEAKNKLPIAVQLQFQDTQAVDRIIKDLEGLKHEMLYSRLGFLMEPIVEIKLSTS